MEGTARGGRGGGERVGNVARRRRGRVGLGRVAGGREEEQEYAGKERSKRDEERRGMRNRRRMRQAVYGGSEKGKARRGGVGWKLEAGGRGEEQT